MERTNAALFVSDAVERLYRLPIARALQRLLALLIYCVVGLGIALAGADHLRLQQVMQQRYGDTGMQNLLAWKQLLQDARDRPVGEQLEMVNTFFNRRIRFAEDTDLWGQKDYWATPIETMGKGAGDCEDYSIAKYMTLQLLGVPNEQLRMIYVNARLGGLYSSVSQAHMVLGYYEDPASDPLILDNLITRVQPGSTREDLKPVFSFNSEGLWAGGSTVSVADPTARLSRWRDLLQRMRDEGFR